MRKIRIASPFKLYRSLYMDDPKIRSILNQQIALQMLLNAHSTAVMAKLGRVVGNTMTNVYPSNLKLTDRATILIRDHVNRILSSARWIKSYGEQSHINYPQANAVLCDIMQYLTSQKQTNLEVGLSIARILESLKHWKPIDWETAISILQQQSLGEYLESLQ